MTLATRKAIVIVDKERILGFDLMQTLRQKNYLANYESNPETARRLIHRKSPDYIIVESESIEYIFAGTLYNEEAIRSFQHSTDCSVVFDRQQRALSVFKKPFLSETIAKFLLDQET
jgi:DNA-binding NtrC family response regulator